jgi:hypothetical protein
MTSISVRRGRSVSRKQSDSGRACCVVKLRVDTRTKPNLSTGLVFFIRPLVIGGSSEAAVRRTGLSQIGESGRRTLCHPCMFTRNTDDGGRFGIGIPISPCLNEPGRMRRGEFGHHHHIAGPYLVQFADLAHVEAAIRILRPGVELEKVVPRHVEFRPRYFKRGALTRLILDFMREHAGETVAVADITPTAIGDRTLNSAEYRRVEVVTYEALHKLARRGTVQQTGQGAKAARWRSGGL